MKIAKNCIVCEKKTNEYEESNEVSNNHSFLCVCDNCVEWKHTNMDLIKQHREVMVSKFSPAIVSAFEDKPALEQGYIVIRSLELQSGK